MKTSVINNANNSCPIKLKKIKTEKQAIKKKVGSFYHPTKTTYRTGACPKGYILKKSYTKKSYVKKNGTVVQQGNSTEMIFNIDQIIAYISTFMTLKKGDLIFTGTPAGVGPVVIGDVLEGFLEGKKMFSFQVK